MASTLEHLRASHVEGIIVVAPVTPVIEALSKIEETMALVVVGGDPRRSAATVTIDQVEGARLATGHLLGLGHRTVHHVRGPRSWVDAAARVQGWTDALRGSAAPRPSPLVGDWSARGGYAAGVRLAQDPDVTAVFAANDQTALGIMRALHEAGRKVPGDISVVGFDDTPESGYFLPALTTIRQDFGEVGRRSVELVLSLMDGEAGSTSRGGPRRSWSCGRARRRRGAAPGAEETSGSLPLSADEPVHMVQRTTLADDHDGAAAPSPARPRPDGRPASPTPLSTVAVAAG